jgi:hypothetical protein
VTPDLNDRGRLILHQKFSNFLLAFSIDDPSVPSLYFLPNQRPYFFLALLPSEAINSNNKNRSGLYPKITQEAKGIS